MALNRTRFLIPKPEWFTLEHYTELKKEGYTDKKIAERLLYVSLRTLTRFKQEIGWKKDMSYNQRPFSEEKMKELLAKGYTYTEISKLMNMSRSTMYRKLNDDVAAEMKKDWEYIYAYLNRNHVTMTDILTTEPNEDELVTDFLTRVMKGETT